MSHKGINGVRLLTDNGEVEILRGDKVTFFGNADDARSEHDEFEPPTNGEEARVCSFSVRIYVGVKKNGVFGWLPMQKCNVLKNGQIGGYVD